MEKSLTGDLRHNELPAKEFAAKVKDLVNNAQYDEVAKVFAERNPKYLCEISEELLQDVCIKNLSESTYNEKPALYNCADEILKQIAADVPSDSLLIELLELLEELRKDYQFTTVLRALQALLLNYGNEKSKFHDWAFNSVRCTLDQLNLPSQLTAGYDPEQAHLLEQDKFVEELLGRYITIQLFYAPIQKQVLQQPREALIFRNVGIKSRRNLLCCFIVQLLGKPLALLDLTVDDERKTNSYTLQIVRKLAHNLTTLIVDAWYFLTLVERHARWTRRLDSARNVYEMSSKNIFLIAERLPLVGLGIYYYMLCVDNEMKADVQAAPKVYEPHFIFESCLYLVNNLLTQDETPLQLRGLLLAQHIVTQLMVGKRLPAVVLELNVHKMFCERLCSIAGYAAQAELRRCSAQLLKKYVFLYDDEGRYLVLRNLLPTVGHMGLKSCLVTIHKDVIATALKNPPEATALPAECSGEKFRDMLLNVICQLPRGVKTDLLDYADPISAALNVIRFYAISDSNNRTGFWDLVGELQQTFFTPLRKGLDYTIAHYKLETKQVEANWDEAKAKEDHQRTLEMLSISISNDKETETDTERQGVFMNRERKLNFLKQNLTTFDLLRSLLARTTELVEQRAKLRKSEQRGEKISN